MNSFELDSNEIALEDTFRIGVPPCVCCFRLTEIFTLQLECVSEPWWCQWLMHCVTHWGPFASTAPPAIFGMTHPLVADPEVRAEKYSR